MRKLKLFLSLLMLFTFSVGNVWADDPTKTEGFETKAASTTYNSTVTISEAESDCGIGWTIYYGTVSTNDKISGTKSAQMRYYSSSDNRGYVQSTTPVEGLTHVDFKARVSSTAIKMTVSYSADGSVWTALATNVTFSESGKGLPFGYDIPSGGKYIKIEIGAGSTKPSSGNIKFIVDDVVFTYTAAPSNPTVSFEQPTTGTLALSVAGSPIESGAEVAENTEVTITATPGEGYKLPATISFKDGENQDVDPNDLTFIENDDKNGGAFLMPAYDLTVAASFTAKAVSAVTVTNPTHGTISVKDGDDAIGETVMEGKVLTVSVTGSGFTFTPKAYKTGDETTVVAIDGEGKLTMPEYAITITADEEQILTAYVTPSVAKVDFGTVAKDASLDAVEFTISGNYLTEGNLSVSLLYGTAFEVSPASIPVNGELPATPITVTALSTATSGTFDDVLVISGGGLAEDVELDVTLTVEEQYTATWYVNGTATKTQTAAAGTALEVPADPETLAAECSDLKFRGWATAPISGSQASAPDFVNFEGAVMGTADANYYAVFATETKEEIEGDPEWVATAFADLASGDSIVVTNTKSDVVYALPNNDGTSSSPDAIIVTVANSKLSAAPNATIKWKAVKDGSTIQFATGTSFLYCTNTNDGVRVGAGAANVFSINTGYLYTTLTTDPRYVGVNGTSDWRCYKSINSNISGATLAFYKKTVSKQEIISYSDFVTTCVICTNVTLTPSEVENGSIALSKESVKTCEAAEVTVTPSPATGYELTGVALSGVDGATYAEGVISIPADAEGTLTVTATFSAINYTVTLEQTGGANAELSATPEVKHFGDEITISAENKEAAGYVFLGWTAPAGVTLANAKDLSTTFTMPASNVTITAAYAPLYTVEQAKELPDGTEKVAIAGIVSEIKSIDPSKYQRAQYYISDNGKTDEQFLIYNGYGVDGAIVSSLEQIVVGDKVVVYGNIGSFEEVTQLAQNNYQLSSVHLSSLTVDASAAKTEYYKNEEFSFDGITATANYADNSILNVTAWANWSADPSKITEDADVTVVASWCGKYGYAYPSVTKVLRPAGLSWSAESAVAYTVGKEYTLPTLNNPNELNNIDLSSSNPAVADFDNGELKIYADGSITITASYTADTEYAGQEVSYTLNIYRPTSLAIEGDAITAYDYGEVFSFEGLTVIGTYGNSETADLTALVTWTADGQAEKIITSNTSFYVQASYTGAAAALKHVEVTLITYTVNKVNPEVGGTLTLRDSYNNIIANGDKLAKTKLITVEATPADGYKDAVITVVRTSDSEDVTATVLSGNVITMPGYAITVSATFEEKLDAPLSWSAEEGIVYLPLNVKENELPTLNNELGLTVTYSSYSEVIATVDENTGVITPVAEGMTFIEAIFAGDDTYKPTTVSFLLTVEQLPVKFYIAGSMTSWETNKIPVYDESYTIENLAAGSYELKVIDGEAWKGFANLTASEIVAGLYAGGGDNICFTLAEAGDVTVTYGATFKMAGNFVPQTVRVKGGWDSWAETHVMILSGDKKSASVTFTLPAAENVQFGIDINGNDFRANGYHYHRGYTGTEGITGNSGNMTLTSDVAGEYTFTWTFGTNAMNITFPDHTYTVAWSLNDGADEALGELEKMGDSDIFAKYFDKDILAVGTYVVKVFQDEETTPITTEELTISEVAKYYVEFDYNASENELQVNATNKGTATELDNTGDGQKAVKMMKDNTIYILRGNKTYTITGQLVK